MNNRARRWVVWVLGLGLVVLGARLGFWQLDRASQKTALQQGILLKKQDLVADSIGFFATESIAYQDADWARQIHRPITLTGQWLPKHTVLLDNRQMNGRPGFFVVTPMRLDGVKRPDGSGLVVAVQRGWLARDFLVRERVAGVPTAGGSVTVSGRIAGAPSRLLALGGSGAVAPARPNASASTPAPASDIRQNLDLVVFGAEVAGAAFDAPAQLLSHITVVQTDPDSPSAGQTGIANDGLLRQWPMPDAGVAKHHGYAFQWFALAALISALLVWFQVIAPIRDRRGLSARFIED